MTDMRATERLLEVIGEKLDALSSMMGAVPLELVEAQMAVAELRRRGDTLVRADDLRRVLPTAEAGVGGYASGEWRDEDEQRWNEARDRLENALSGKMR